MTRKTAAPQAPAHLDDEGRRKWGEVLAILDDRGDTLDAGTLDAAAAYSLAWSRWTAAEQQVNTLGAVVKSPAGFAVPNPYIAIAAAAQRQMRQWGDVLGLHKHQGRQKAKEPDADQGDQGEGLLKLLGGRKTKAG